LILARLLSLWLPVLAWLGVSFTASAQSDVGVLGRIPDWITHGAEYLVLGLLLCRALAGGFRARLTPATAALAVTLGTAWGVSDEWHQSFVPARDASAADVAKDFGGCTLAALVHLRLLGRSQA
jgi:VanZ family protein